MHPPHGHLEGVGEPIELECQGRTANVADRCVRPLSAIGQELRLDSLTHRKICVDSTRAVFIEWMQSYTTGVATTNSGRAIESARRGVLVCATILYTRGATSA